LSDGVSVDACVMVLFAKSFRPGNAEPGVAEAKALVTRIRSTIGFALDAGGKIQHQWLAGCGSKAGGPFCEWFLQSVKEGRIRPVVPSLPEEHRKQLRIALGFPPGQFEETYIGVANVTATRYILTEDMDFFEPKHKNADAHAKCRSRDERQGGVCRYLLQRMKIRVGTIAHAECELWEASQPAAG
jgi:hypothetical protein